MLMTCAPSLAATLIPLASDCWICWSCSASYVLYPGSPLSGITRMDSSLACGATPMIPLPPPSCPWPAMIDAIQVPCTPQLESDDEVLSPVRSGPVCTEPARSLTDGFTPLSTTATVTPAPWLIPQAEGTSSMLSTHCWLLLTASDGAAEAGATDVTNSIPARAKPPASAMPRGREAVRGGAIRGGVVR